MIKFNVKDTFLNDFFNKQFRYMTSNMVHILYDKKYTYVKDMNETDFILDKEKIITLMDLKKSDLISKTQEYTDLVVGNLSKLTFFEILKDTINKIYDTDTYTPTLQDKYVMLLLLSVNDNYIKDNVDNTEAYEIVYALLSAYNKGVQFHITKELVEFAAENYGQTLKRFSGNFFSVTATKFLFDDRKDLEYVILNGKLPLRKYTLEELIEENRTFKEINNLYNKNFIER